MPPQPSLMMVANVITWHLLQHDSSEVMIKIQLNMKHAHLSDNEWYNKILRKPVGKKFYTQSFVLYKTEIMSLNRKLCILNESVIRFENCHSWTLCPESPLSITEAHAIQAKEHCRDRIEIKTSVNCAALTHILPCIVAIFTPEHVFTK